MKQLISMLLFTCACTLVQAQVNYVKNPDFEEYISCPLSGVDNITYVLDWNALNYTVSVPRCIPEYCQACTGAGLGVPDGGSFYYQYAHSGNGMVTVLMYYDHAYPEPVPPDYDYERDYLRGKLIKHLTAGKSYCVSFYTNTEEMANYGINKMGAYLDDGSIDTVTHCSLPITFVTPQMYSKVIIADTQNWVQVQGSFIANGTEAYITIGNFFSMTNTATVVMPGADPTHYSYYLIDDVSVVESDLDAVAGPDTYVEETKTVQIGRVGDTTAKALDCKWYHKGDLIDSGAIITVHAAATTGIIDTYVVVQSICGSIKTDTVLVSTVGLGLKEQELKEVFHVFPNPSDGSFVISSNYTGSADIYIYDLTGRLIHQQGWQSGAGNISLLSPAGSYILEFRDANGNTQRQRISIY